MFKKFCVINQGYFFDTTLVQKTNFHGLNSNNPITRFKLQIRSLLPTTIIKIRLGLHNLISNATLF